MNKSALACLAAGTLIFSALLVWLDPAQAGELFARLLPIFGFVIGMSVVVNLASDFGAFEEVTRWIEHRAPRSTAARKAVIWVGILVLAVLVTVFFSLDTTAILITPLAILLARRNGLSVMATAISVVWIANIGSLVLPVSNLTNLLAVGGGYFSSPAEYYHYVFLPAIAALAVVGAASWLVQLRAATGHAVTAPHPRAQKDPLLVLALVVIGCLLPALVSPIPYWVSSTLAAVILACAAWWQRRESITLDLVPWSALVLATGFSVLATLLSIVGGAAVVQDLLGGAGDTPSELFAVAGAGVVASNVINNIPGYLMLEPAVTTPSGVTALLIGVNAGPLITPWASLATLLWHDQLKRVGVQFAWKRFIVAGLVIVPISVGIPTAVLIAQVS